MVIIFVHREERTSSRGRTRRSFREQTTSSSDCTTSSHLAFWSVLKMIMVGGMGIVRMMAVVGFTRLWNSGWSWTVFLLIVGNSDGDDGDDDGDDDDDDGGDDGNGDDDGGGDGHGDLSVGGDDAGGRPELHRLLRLGDPVHAG